MTAEPPWPPLVESLDVVRTATIKWPNLHSIIMTDEEHRFRDILPEIRWNGCSVEGLT
jgi:hypothetical protein